MERVWVLVMVQAAAVAVAALVQAQTVLAMAVTAEVLVVLVGQALRQQAQARSALVGVGRKGLSRSDTHQPHLPQFFGHRLACKWPSAV